MKNGLRDFITLGAEIIETDTAKRYGQKWADRLLQPGFTPLGKTDLAIVNCNPSQGDFFWIKFREEALQERKEYERWAKEADLAAYKDAYQQWLRRSELWDVFGPWVRPLLEEVPISKTAVTWLNMVKLPTKNANQVSKRMVAIDLPWLERQLEIIDPPAILVGGTGVFRHLQEFLESKHQGKVVVQDRIRSKTTAERDKERQYHVTHIRSLMVSNQI